ncbi:histidine kinase [Pseudoxanthomonas sp. LjRoot143]|uniref:sensor histidine kinase n=1 Tax=Pseudoxanthomonas sp. LjRoot143 TaxID=3342266 RepID=UPI003ECFF07A
MNTPGHSPLDALFRPVALIAVLLAGEALALIIALSSHASGGRLIQFGLTSLGIQWICLSTLCTTFLLRQPLARLRSPTVAWICLGILLCMTLLVTLAAWSLFATPGDLADGKWSFVLRALAIALVVGLLTLLTYQNYWRAKQLAVSAEHAKLQALQARIQPHFLFNTLNTGISLLHAKPDLAEQLLLDLSDLFRAALSQRESLRLSEDISLARRYLEIEQLRLGDRLRLTWDIPDELPALQVPTLSIQPLAENAIRHGIEPSTTGGDVSIRISTIDGFLQVAVSNSLPPASSRAAAGHQVGLSSVRARIHASTQGRGRVDTRVADGLYTATIRLPLDVAG